MGCSYGPPPKGRRSKRKSLAVLDIEALAREAYESSKLKVQAERKVTKEPKKATESEEEAAFSTDAE